MKLNRIIVFFIAFVFFSQDAMSQLEASTWYFGPRCSALHFPASSPPSVIANGYTPFNAEGCSVLSDPITGALRFYTDGQTVLDASHQPMPNGSGLISVSSSWGSGKIAVDPGNCNRFYIFHNDAAYEGGGGEKKLYYTIVDMRLPGNGTAASPKGDVDVNFKNILIAENVGEGIEIISKDFTHEFWLITTTEIPNFLSLYKVSATAITYWGNAVLSNSPRDVRAIRYSKANGKLAIASCNDYDPVYIMDFSSAFGMFSKEVTVPGLPPGLYGDYHGVYDVCWSPNGSKLYISKYREGDTGGKLYQHDLETGVTQLVYDVHATSKSFAGRGLKVGPDGKMYYLYMDAASGEVRYLGAVNNPNNPVATCDFNARQVDMGADMGNANKFPDFLYISDSLIGYKNLYVPIQLACNASGAVDTIIPSMWDVEDVDMDKLSYTILPTHMATSTAVFTPGRDLHYTNTAAPPYRDTVTIEYCEDYCIKKCRTFTVIFSVAKETAGPLNLVPFITSCGDFTIALDAGPGMVDYKWSTGETAQNIVVATSGIYTVTATGTNGCTYKDTTQVLFTAAPVTGLKDTISCDSVVLKVDPTFASIKWNTGSTAPSIVAKTTGLYSVTVKDLYGCSVSDTITVTIQSPPTIDIGGPYYFCGNTPINLTLSVSGMKDVWWSTGSTGSSIVVTATGTYSVKVMDPYGCIATDQTTVSTAPVPQPDFKFNNACKEALVSFTDQSVITSGTIQKYEWNLGDGSMPVFGQLIQHIYQQAGIFAVKLTVTSDLGCRDSLVQQLTIHDSPAVAFNYTSLCDETSIHFTDHSVSTDNITSWNWDFGDGNVATQQNTSHLYVTKGDYLISLSVKTDKGCTSKAEKLVTVYSPLLVDFAVKNVCEGSAVQFTNHSQIDDHLTATFLWDFGDASGTQTVADPTHLYTSSASYPVKLIVQTSSGCVDSVLKQVVVNPAPKADLEGNPLKGCAPLFVNFSDLSTITSGKIVKWTWDFGNGYSDLKNPERLFLNPGTSPLTISVKLKVTSDSGCIANVAYPNYITVYPKPVADFSLSPTITSINEPLITITNNTIGTDSVWWNFGDQKTSTVFQPLSHVYTESGTYMITLFAFSTEECADTLEQEVIIKPHFTFYVPNAFTPNDDGDNDTFSGKGINISEYEMIIFNRWGQVMFRTTDFHTPWNGGKNNTKEMAAADVYIYTIRIVDVNSKKHAYRGTVTLVR